MYMRVSETGGQLCSAVKGINEYDDQFDSSSVSSSAISLTIRS